MELPCFSLCSYYTLEKNGIDVTYTLATFYELNDDDVVYYFVI